MKLIIIMEILPDHKVSDLHTVRRGQGKQSQGPIPVRRSARRNPRKTWTPLTAYMVSKLSNFKSCLNL